MSSLIFPTLPGQLFTLSRTPVWKTMKQESPSGKQSAIALRLYPLIKFKLGFDLLRDNITPSEVKAIVGLHMQLQGSFDTFLYSDPDFNSVTNQNFGTGNGTAGPFQLVASYQNTGGPGYAELVQNWPGGSPPVISVSGVVQTSGTAYTLGPTGIVTFLAGHFPAVSAPITWTGSFYYRCRFDADTIDVEKLMYQWWGLKSLGFTSVKL